MRSMTKSIVLGSGWVALSIEEVQRLRHQAEQGNAEAQFELGWMYRKGKGVPKNNAEAVKWFRLAAEQGHIKAQCSLGWIYSRGEDNFPQDGMEALKWYWLAAEQGHGEASFQRDKIEKRMTKEAITTAQRLAREWQPKTMGLTQGGVKPAIGKT